LPRASTNLIVFIFTSNSYANIKSMGSGSICRNGYLGARFLCLQRRVIMMQTSRNQSMRQTTSQISVSTRGQRLYDITPQVKEWAAGAGMQTGVLTLYIQHTSASLLINENYDSDVLVDMEAFFARLVPDGDPLFIHTV